MYDSILREPSHTVSIGNSANTINYMGYIMKWYNDSTHLHTRKLQHGSTAHMPCLEHVIHIDRITVQLKRRRRRTTTRRRSRSSSSRRRRTATTRTKTTRRRRRQNEEDKRKKSKDNDDAHDKKRNDSRVEEVHSTGQAQHKTEGKSMHAGTVSGGNAVIHWILNVTHNVVGANPNPALHFSFMTDDSVSDNRTLWPKRWTSTQVCTTNIDITADAAAFSWKRERRHWETVRKKEEKQYH